MSYDLSSIQSGPSTAPPRILIYGEHGLGKSTWASGAPSPIVIQTEDGLGSIDVDSMPLCEKFGDVISCISALVKSDHKYATVVLDSLDWCEQLISAHVIDTHEKSDLGYGKDKAIEARCMRRVLDGLNILRTKKSMTVILTAHAITKRHDDPSGESWDRSTLALGKHSGAMAQEWCDVVAYASHKIHVKKTETGFGRSVASGKSLGRIMRTQSQPAFDAKSRYKIPSELDLSWGAFETAMSAQKPKSTKKETVKNG